MAKPKNKLRKSSDAINSRKQINKTMNPFEVHINKEKMRVLGKKTKNSTGLPGVSRAKGIQKRKETLLQEYKTRNKNNVFQDKRLGEKNKLLTEDDRETARFTALRARTHKKSIFNLADDEVLTHRGKVISEIEKFEDPRSDDEESLDGTGRLDSSFVGNAHFAGGIFKNTQKDGVKSHKDVIDELIAESKKRKAEKQQVKEATLKLTEQLDQEWRDLMPLMAKRTKPSEVETEEKPKPDDYDKLARQLKFEAKVHASDRLKSEEELAKEEKEKLEQLENERLDRMRGVYENNKPQHVTHRSADDLCDDFVIDDLGEDMLTYNTEGEANVKIHAELDGKEIIVSNKHDESSDEEESSEEEEESEGDDNPESSDEPEEASQSEDDLADLKEQNSDSEEEDSYKENCADTELHNSKENQQSEHTDGLESGTGDVNIDLQNKILKDLEERKDIMEKARSELPYTFDIPQMYESFEQLFVSRSAEEQSVILERMIKCNHPSLSEANKDKLHTLFTFMLQFLNDIACDVSDYKTVNDCFRKFSAVAPYIFDLAQYNKEEAIKTLLEVIKEKHIEYRKKFRSFPGVEVIIFLKLVSLLCPTSDYRHPVVTPCFIFLDQMLTRCKVNCKRDISFGLLLVTLVLEYTTLSKRLLPAAINFLNGLLHMALPKFSVRIVKVLPPFRATSTHLVLRKQFTDNISCFNMNQSDLLDGDLDDDYKVRTLHTVVQILNEFHINYKELPSCGEIFEKTLSYLEMLPNEKYPENVQSAITVLISDLNTSKSQRSLKYVTPPVKRPKAMRLFEPKIEEVYDGKRYKSQSKEKANQAKLMHKLKREKKGALREIRRDQSFLSRVKIKETIKSDKERRDKVKRIYAEAAMQQSELNALDRSKKRK